MPTTTIVTRAGKGSALTHTEMDTNWNNLLGATIYVGSIVIWPSASLPDSKWLECAGQSLATASYPDLFTLIGYTYGGSGASFNLPDLRGQFVRGWNHGASTDPDAASRTNRGDGTTGDSIGTKQSDAFEAHTHTGVPHAGADVDRGTGSSLFSIDITSSTGSTGGNETRPTNIALMYIIKALK